MTDGQEVAAKPATKEDLNLIRTDLANERTILAYGRTALMVTGTGVTLIKFFADTQSILATGWILAFLGLIIGVIGATRFACLHARLHPPSD